LADGDGAGKDYSQAFKFLSLAAEQNHPFAVYYLGILYQHGHGVLLSCEDAVRNYRKIAELGQKVAEDEAVTKLVLKGDYGAALMAYAEGASKGVAKYAHNVAYLYDEATSGALDIPLVKDMKNPRKAATKFWSRAALAGDAHAITMLGDHHFHGFGVKADFAKAARFYSLAADVYREPRAIYSIGYMHQHVRSPSPEEAQEQ